ncbi:DUF5995 family protein [Streptomyces cyaneofuscatus]|uniref:DUF5995 family protein n=1 Tax=Streptomyces TaxID=1883 RepID=UPI0004CB0F00|nr:MULTISPECIES: DUF5995 family protein [Streptomyces]ONI48923.1 hypothetical protein STIB_69730 [Streptomyces sp. IB2014 011-1]RDV50331.1 hypothetical protein DDV98_19065 [Streptomyces sp. IB2014 011-12]
MAQIEQFAEPAVLARTHRWPPGDGVGVFHDVRQAMGWTAAPAGTLEARLAERYLSALDAADAGRRPPECRRPLFRYRHHPGVRPVQFALAGLHAHIAHDLVLAVVDTCRTRDCEPAALEGEFERVGDLLALLEERIHDELMPGPDLLRIADPLTHLVSTWSLERAREAAWTAARVLRQLRGFSSAAEEFAEQNDAGAGLVVRFLLTPCR